MNEQTLVFLVLAGCVTTIQVAAFSMHIDGQVLALTSSILTGILAYSYAKKKK